MSLPLPARRKSLAQSYRDLGERQIRAKLEGPLSDVERVTARAELLRRGIESDEHDTAPATGFAPTSALDLIEAAYGHADPASTARAAAGRRRPGRGVAIAVVVLALAGGVAWFAFGHLPGR